MDELALLQELIREYEELLNHNAPAVNSQTELFRGDKRSMAELPPEGFVPKKNGGEQGDYYNVLLHCTENGYGGPFISAAKCRKRAEDFATSGLDSGKGYVYTFAAGLPIVDFDRLQIVLKGRLDEMGMQAEAVGKKEGDYTPAEKMLAVKCINETKHYKAVFDTACRYRKAQEEELVLGAIPMGSISEPVPVQFQQESD